MVRAKKVTKQHRWIATLSSRKSRVLKATYFNYPFTSGAIQYTQVKTILIYVNYIICDQRKNLHNEKVVFNLTGT